MRLFNFRGTSFRIHPLFPLILLSYFLSGQQRLFCAYFLALFAHEAGHYFVASALRLPVSQLELTPFGGTMQIELADGLPPRKAFLLATAGILSNFLLLLPTVAALFSLPFSPFLFYFALANLLMILVNLLPFLPLDGGRMLLALLSVRFHRALVFKALLLLGRVLALSLLCYAVFSACWSGEYHFALIFLCLYLLYASALEERHSVSRYLAALITRRLRVEKGTALPVQHLCAHAATPLHMLLPQLQPNAYHLIEVVDADACEILGTLHENQLLSAALDTPFITLRELLLRAK